MHIPLAINMPIKLLCVLILLTSCTTMSTDAPDSSRKLILAEQGYFFVGGHYTKTADGEIRVGQMYVQYQIPENRTQPYPVVMWHGGGQTGTNFMGTPDGRKGWGDDFLQRGYAVYIVDQPGRARSGFFTDVYGPTRRPNTGAMSSRFTAPEKGNLYPQAKLHTQWPGSGVPGDETFDQFFASQVEDIRDLNVIEQMNRDAGVALLDRIGPAVLLTHSQSGPFGWALADARPKLVKGILAIEPNGPPFYENTIVGEAKGWFQDGPMGRAWGITRNALTYSPAVNDPKDLRMTREAAPSGPDLVRCWLPAQPAPQLTNLKGIPILIVASEASYHAPYDHCTSQYLRNAGVANDFVRLTDLHIHGNGHMMMLEKNNLEIAAFLDRWSREHIK
ncbi:MAG TPA: alpha/beta hydrolase [Burkholderiales bacterium]|nr:alpha/beta hydrolase [Burkholderiales bacterium]